MGKLTDVQVRAAPVGKISDGAGLWLNKHKNGSAYWFLRYTMHGNRGEIGLGVYPDMSLRSAREAADEQRALVRSGLDPRNEREKAKQEHRRDLKLLRDVAADCFESRKAQLKGDGKNGRWFSPLELHVLPKLGKKPVAEIDQIDIRDAFAPIWHTKAPTAMKAIDRLNICIRHGAALGLNVDLQAVPKAKLLLGKQRHKTEHIVRLPWQDTPAFYASLNGGTTVQLALRLLILTAGTRSAPIRFCHVDQIGHVDKFDGLVWTVPGELMKSHRGKEEDFDVPLSDEALKIIEEAKALSRDGFLFPGKTKGVISDMAMSKYMKDKGLDARPHGFRATFRDWCTDEAEVDFEIKAKSLAHKIGNKTTQAYDRTKALKRRAILMQSWANFVTGRANDAENSNVVELSSAS